MPCKFNTFKSIKQGIIGPNILFPAAYLLFSAEVCTGSLKNKPIRHSANPPLLSLPSKPVDRPDTIEALSQSEYNPYWSPEWLALNRWTRCSVAEKKPSAETKLPVEKRVEVLPEGAAEGIIVASVTTGEEVGKGVGEVAAATASLEMGQEFDGKNTPTFNPINVNRKSLRSLESSIARSFPICSTTSNRSVSPDSSTDDTSVDQPMEKDQTKKAQEGKGIQEMDDRVSSLENCTNSQNILQQEIKVL